MTRTPSKRLTLVFILALAFVAGLKLIPDAPVEPADKALTFEDFTGRVVGIIDGDTIDVMHNGKAERIRLYGIDCPEKGQPFGKDEAHICPDPGCTGSLTNTTGKSPSCPSAARETHVNNSQSPSSDAPMSGNSWRA